MRNILIIILLLCGISVPAAGQNNDSVYISGTVSDAFSRERMVGVEVCVYDNNGFFNVTHSYSDQYRSPRYGIKVPRAGKYVLGFAKNGYVNKTMVVDIPARKYMQRVTSWSAGDILLNRSREYKLGEATVTASRIMMVQRGDTIVYNAAAFQLAEGSMLDALIAQLPGAKIEKGGVITINGQFVQSLLVNGKEFFRGDPKIALDNLPAYMVKDVKAYQREPETAYLLGKRTETERKNDPWVLDVNLKRQYHQGWVANAEAAYGTDNRWLGRLFGLRFTDHSRIALYGSGNNVNNTHKPGSAGDWDDEQTPGGNVEAGQGGVMFSVDGKKTKIKFDTSLRADHKKRHDLAHTATTNFLTGNNTYGRSTADSRTKEAKVNWDARLFIPFKRMAVTFEPTLSYSRTRRHSGHYASLWNSEPPAGADTLWLRGAWPEELVNATTDIARGLTKTWGAGGHLRTTFKSPLLGRAVKLHLIGSLGKTSQHDFSQYTLSTGVPAVTDYRNRYTDLPSHNYRWSAHLEYKLYRKMKYNNGVDINFLYQYAQNNQSGGRSLYRLDSLGGNWSVPGMGGRRIGSLPSTRDSLLLAADWSNTYRTSQMERTHRPDLWLTANGKWGSLSLSLPLSVVRRSIRDYRLDDFSARTAFSRRSVAFEPSVRYYAPGKVNLSVSYRRNFQPAPLSSMLEVRDDSNPLYIMEGNRHLKDAWQNDLDISFRRSKAKKSQMLSAGAGLWIQERGLGYARCYDTATGVTTVSPRNINGNWGSNASLSFEQGWEKTAASYWEQNRNSHTNIVWTSSTTTQPPLQTISQKARSTTIRLQRL